MGMAPIIEYDTLGQIFETMNATADWLYRSVDVCTMIQIFFFVLMNLCDNLIINWMYRILMECYVSHVKWFWHNRASRWEIVINYGTIEHLTTVCFDKLLEVFIEMLICCLLLVEFAGEKCDQFRIYLIEKRYIHETALIMISTMKRMYLSEIRQPLKQKLRCICIGMPLIIFIADVIEPKLGCWNNVNATKVEKCEINPYTIQSHRIRQYKLILYKHLAI